MDRSVSEQTENSQW